MKYKKKRGKLNIHREFKMKYLISLFCAIWLFISFHNSCFSQDEKFHQVIYGADSSDIINYYPANFNAFNETKAPLNYDFVLTVKADFRLDYVWIFNSDSLNLFYLPDTSFFQINVPGGIINILTGQNITNHQNLIFLKDSVVVDSSITLHLYKNEADKNLFFEFLKEDYSPIHINALALKILYNEVYNQGLAIVNASIDTTTFWFKCNESLSIFENEWSIKGKQLDNDGKLYLLNNSIDSIYNNLTITNDPINLTHADFQYRFPDSVEQDSPHVQVGTTNYGYHFYPNDPNYYQPFSFRVLQDTSSDISLNMSKFEQVINATNTYGADIITSEMRISANNVKGYTTVSRYDTPFLISENKTVHIGVTPTYYYGQCQNTENEIRISAPFNYPIAQQPFLSLTNDVLKHFPYNLKLFHGGNLVEERMLNIRWGHHNHIIFGCEPNDLVFSVMTNAYELIAFDYKCEIAGMDATTTANLKFDLSLPDKNPPNMTAFQILCDNTISNVLDNAKNNIIRFRIEDDHYISNTYLYYSIFGDTIWIELPLMVNNTYFETQVPLLANGYYSLKTICKDISNNCFEMIMNPAFLMESTSSISKVQQNPIKFELYQNYPNPFNNQTNISFLIPNQDTKNINLSIYNTLGEKIITLVDGNMKPGIKKYIWNGKNKNNQYVSSGVYFLQLKGGDFKKRKKIILIK